MSATTGPTMLQVVHAPAGGPPEGLRIEGAPRPVARSGELLIKVQAAGVNRPDIMQRSGKYPPPPGASSVMGLEVAGTVAAIGPDTDANGFSVGDTVCALVNGGGYATWCTAPAGQCLPWPAGLDAVHAAALPETCFTVWSNLFRTGRLAAGETVLVHGGTSGIGSIAIQMARSFGARVFATCGSAEKVALAVSLGAEAAIDYRTEDFAERVHALTGGRGVDLVLDMIGAAYLERNLASLADLGRLVVVALQGGAIADKLSLARIMTGRLTITGSTLRPRDAAFKAEIAQALLQNVWPLIETGTIRPLIHAVLPFSEVAAAHRLMESGAHAGKIVLTMGETAT